MLKKLLVALIIYAFAEVGILIYVGNLIGGVRLFFILLLSALFGVWMVWRQGFSILQKARDDLMQRRMPGEEILDGLGLLIGGACLCVPGLISDLVGLLLLVPPVRVVLIIRLKRWLRAQINRGGITFISFK